MGESRTKYAVMNFSSSTVSNVVNLILSFASQTVFIRILGETYLGINGLFTNLLGLLSLAELGVGSAISFSLYKPIAQNDTAKVQAIINFYRAAYRVIATVVVVVGLLIMPLLKYIVKGAEGVQNVYLIYCIYLTNTVSSYLISYKSTILSADQRNYLLTNINTVVKVVTTAAQITMLVLFHNYLLYLLIEAALLFISKIYINHFVNVRYPYLKGKNPEKLSKDEKNVIFTKIKALLFHKVGEVTINQTDNIITSAFINVATVGLVSNFVMITKAVNTFAMSFFSSAVAGLGNLIATENYDKRYRISKNYDYLGFLLYGWSAVVLYFCLPPFVSVWLGDHFLIDQATVALLCINYYMTGARVPLGNIRSAAGIYEPDKWVPLAQSLTNIVVSIVAVQYWGLKGVYIGTLISSFFPTIVRPIIVYKYAFGRNSGSYFKNYICRLIFLLCNVVVIALLLRWFNVVNPFWRFLTAFGVSAVVSAAAMVLATRKTEEFAYAKKLMMSVTGPIMRKLKRRG